MFNACQSIPFSFPLQHLLFLVMINIIIIVIASAENGAKPRKGEEPVNAEQVEVQETKVTAEKAT